MKRITVIAVICMVAVSFGPAFAGEKAPQEVVDLANSKLAEIGKDPVIIKAVKAANAQRKSLSGLGFRQGCGRFFVAWPPAHSRHRH